MHSFFEEDSKSSVTYKQSISWEISVDLGCFVSVSAYVSITCASRIPMRDLVHDSKRPY